MKSSAAMLVYAEIAILIVVESEVSFNRVYMWGDGMGKLSIR